MLLKEFTGFDDVIIGLVTLQPQNILCKHFKKKKFQQANNFTSITCQTGFSLGASLPPTPGTNRE